MAILRRLTLPAVVLLLTTAAFILTKAARDSLYFQPDGLADLPWAYLGIALLAWPVSMGAITAMRMAGFRRARVLLVTPVALFNLFLALTARPGGGPFMTAAFVAIPLFYGVLLSIGWLLGAELLSETGVRRPEAYGFLGSASMAGGVAGALVARWMGSWTGPNSMFAAGAAILIAAAAVVHWTHARHRSGEPPSQALRGPEMRLRPLLRERYTLWLLLLAGIGSAVGVFIEFQFYVAATGAASDLEARSEFFGNFYVVLTLTALILQVFFVPRVQRRLGVWGSLMILPLVLLGAGAALAAGSVAAGLGGLRIAESGLRASVHRSNWEQVYLPFESGFRDVAKLLVDGMGARFAEGLAAIVLLIWVGNRAPAQLLDAGSAWISYTVVAGAFVWVMAVRLLRLPPQCEDRSAASPKMPESCVMTATVGGFLLESRHGRDARPRAAAGDFQGYAAVPKGAAGGRSDFF